MFESIMEGVGAVNGWLWGPWAFVLLAVAGIFFSVCTKFVQYRSLTHGVQCVRGVYDDPDDPGAINHFQALMAALSATIGLGNIGGVALAIGLGGPGALFWMWILGFLGMALKTAEITLAMIYRNTDDPDNPHGGAMWVIDRTLGSQGGWKAVAGKTMAFFFCTCLIVSTMTGGNMFQSWNVADLSNTYFGIPKIGTGILLATLVGMVIIGGIKRIGNVAGRLVPFMCVIYVLSALAVIFANIVDVPGLLALVVRSAFSPTEAAGAFTGGVFGTALAIGVKRALFSNEAGQGSAPIAHAAAKTSEPAREGILGGIGPFIDTIIICTLTALVILTTGTWNRDPLGEIAGGVSIVENGDSSQLLASTSVSDLPDPGDGTSWQVGGAVFLLIDTPEDGRQKLQGNLLGPRRLAETIEWEVPPPGAKLTMTGVYRDFKGAALTAHAFDRQFPGLGKYLVTLAAWFFAISTMISWSYYGEQGVVYMFKGRFVLPYKVLFLVLAIIAPIVVGTDAELADLADFGTGWMLWANLPIVLLMGMHSVRSISDYNRRLDAGEFVRRDGR